MKRGAGFTLIEMLVVLAVVGLGAALVASRATARGPGLELRSAAVAVRDLLRLARAQAIGANRPVVVEAGTHGLGIAGGRALVLPTRIALAAPTAIGFGTDGTATGGVLVLSEGTRRILIDVDWLTGRVRLAEAR